MATERAVKKENGEKMKIEKKDKKYRVGDFWFDSLYAALEYAWQNKTRKKAEEKDSKNNQ